MIQIDPSTKKKIAQLKKWGWRFEESTIDIGWYYWYDPKGDWVVAHWSRAWRIEIARRTSKKARKKIRK